MKTKITINGITKEIELTPDQAKQFEESKVWMLKVGDNCWSLNAYGTVCQCEWVNDKLDNYFLKTNKAYQTEKECEFNRVREIVTAELKNYAKEHNKPIDWKDTKQWKYFISWSYVSNEISFEGTKIRHSDIYFSSDKIAKAAVKAVDPDRVKKYYLGVED